MKRYLITLEYDGAGFCGYQIQEGKRTVQQTVQDAIERATGERSVICASGRTDSGVHAAAQTAHFDSSTSIPADSIPYALNAALPDDVAVKSCIVVPDGFHARYDVERKTYRYLIYTSAIRSPLKEKRYCRVPYALDVDRMKEAARHFIGEHDFRAFMASGSGVKTTVRTIYALDIETSGDEMAVTVTGSGFLYNMVRIVCGTLVDVGRGKMSPDDIPRIIVGGDRKAAGATLPAEGLYLFSVEYRKDAFEVNNRLSDKNSD